MTKNNPRGEGNLIYHLQEIRKRIVACAWFTLITCCFAYYKLDDIILFITKPLLNNGLYRLMSTSMAETFLSYVGLALNVGIGISAPFYAWQLYLFLRPALFENERKIALATLLAFVIMFLLGCCILYYAVLPNAINFLAQYKSFSPVVIDRQISLHTYISSLAQFFVGFGMAMQMPLVIILLVRARFMKTIHLQGFRKFAIVIIFIIAGIITPPDVPSQLIVGSVLMLLYEITIIICRQIEPIATNISDLSDNIEHFDQDQSKQ